MILPATCLKIWRKPTVLLFCLLTLTTLVNAQRKRQSFDKDWKFFLGDDSLASASSYPDKKWRTLNLPHDWSIEGTFKESNPATTQGGALPGGIGWYRKHFVITKAELSLATHIAFDGVYRNSEVWINGHYLGKRPNGYISFQYDLSPYLVAGTNLVAVKVDNSKQPNSRWYTGSGIYRNVWLVQTNRIAIAANGSFVRCKITADESVRPAAGQSSTHHAVVSATINLENATSTQQRVVLSSAIFDPQNKVVATVTPITAVLNAGSNGTKEFQIELPHAQLWSTEKPVLYKMVTRVMQNGKLIDEYSTPFGIRSFYFDKDKGFFLNDRSMKIRGVCMHHDLGALGAAMNTRALQRQLEILKAMGCNAIRTAHNPPAPELLDLCDRMGFLVMVEAFDMWRKKKNKFDYYSDFPQWYKRDIEDMVLRDRNHPSVFMWSIGNEIREQFDSTGISIAKELVNIIKSIDSTRPVTAALSEWDPKKNFIYQSGSLDVVGLNYHEGVYADFQKYYPGESFLGTENMSALATRGYYDFPSDSTYFWPAKSPQRYVEHGNADYTVSAYDQVAAYWGSTHEQTWKIIKKYPFLSGLFVWTGFDYLGEPTPYPWPARSSYFGIVDLAGFPKDAYYMYQSEWTSKPVLHVFPHWSFDDSMQGKPVDIWAYYNQADEVELFVNGRSMGVKSKAGEELHVSWRVPFNPGSIKVVSRKNGQPVLQKIISTAGKPAQIELIADRKQLKADGNDLSFVTVRVLDAQGRFVPGANNNIVFTVTGTGRLQATDNGYQADTTSFSSPVRKSWKGLALAIVRAGEKKGNITLMARSPGLRPAILTLKTGD